MVQFHISNFVIQVMERRKKTNKFASAMYGYREGALQTIKKSQYNWEIKQKYKIQLNNDHKTHKKQ